jgi:hypothetical protein
LVVIGEAIMSDLVEILACVLDIIFSCLYERKER